MLSSFWEHSRLLANCRPLRMPEVKRGTTCGCSPKLHTRTKLKLFNFNETSMSFRKRNVPLLGSGATISSSHDDKFSQAGVRISPLTSHPTISTGTSSLDKLLGLGAGLALGTSLLIEEEGTTDFASALLRCFAAEGILQNQKVFVVVPDGWAKQLPGVVEERGSTSAGESERMKIAWRYENVGAHGEERRPPGGWRLIVQYSRSVTRFQRLDMHLHTSSTSFC